MTPKTALFTRFLFQMKMRTALVAMLALLGCTCTAHAATATISDPGSDLAGTDVERLDVTWDGAALTVALRYAAEPFSFAFRLRVSASAAAHADRACSTSDADSIAIRAGETSARLTMSFLDEVVVAPRAWDGVTARYTFTSEALVDALGGPDPRDPFTCVSGDADGDELFGAFEGKALRLTPALLRQALTDALARRYGTRFMASSRRWLRCPAAELLPETDETAPLGLCQFEFRDHGALFRGGGYVAALVYGTVETRDLSSFTYSKRLRRCRPLRSLTRSDPMVLDRTLSASGFVGCRDDGASMIRDLHGLRPGLHRVGLHGTNRLGFEAQATFRCRLGRRASRFTAVCENRLGDGFRYAYTLQPKPKPKPPPQRTATGCDPSYTGACLDPNASDYDCAGGSGDGPLYTGEVGVVGDDHFGLDADGDGVGCEP
jgi:hypothetical protein